MPWLKTTADGVLLRLRVVPRATKNVVQGPHGDRLKVRLQAPPVDGKANRALLKFLAGALGVSASALELVSGETGRDKTVRVCGLAADQVRERLRRAEP